MASLENTKKHDLMCLILLSKEEPYKLNFRAHGFENFLFEAKQKQ